MKINGVKELVNKYGASMTLGQLLTKIQGNKIYECPKCKGKGFLTIEYNCYPTGLSDSGWVYEPAYKDEECNLCNGEGYTDHEYKPITELIEMLLTDTLSQVELVENEE